MPLVLKKGPRSQLKGLKDTDYIVVPEDWTVGQLMAALRRRIELGPADGMRACARPLALWGPAFDARRGRH